MHARAALMLSVLGLSFAGLAIARDEPPTADQTPDKTTQTTTQTTAQANTASPQAALPTGRSRTPSAEELGKRVGDALRGATDLRYVEHVAHLGQRVEVRAWMRQDAFRTEAAIHGRTVYAVSIVDGQVSEFLARGGPGADGTPTQDMEYRYPASSPVSIDNANACNRDFGCMIGSNLSTWIGPQSTTPQRIENNIARGSQPMLVRLDDGREAYFTHFEVTVGPADSRSILGHSYYIDPATSMVLRWETSQQNGEDPKIVRVRDYTAISTDPAPSDFAWAVRADQFQARTSLTAAELTSRQTQSAH